MVMMIDKVQDSEDNEYYCSRGSSSYSPSKRFEHIMM
jgi:hypothetical protein